MTLDDLNGLPREDFVAALAEVFEHAAWVAGAVAPARPFPTVTALHAAMMAALRAAPEETQRLFLGGHPDLAGSAARRRTLAAFSADEQGSLGLDRLDDARFAEFERLNAAYRDRFGLPFLICVRRHTRSSILREFARRLERTQEGEFTAAMAEVFYITRLRLAGLVDGPGIPDTMGWLSTHVLDTAAGRPAAGVPVRLFERDGEALLPLASGVTNADGRLDTPLLAGGPLRIGWYELRFDVSGYFATTADPPYLDVIPIRFAIAEAEAHYHVPLLVSPFSYSTYRGS